MLYPVELLAQEIKAIFSEIFRELLAVLLAAIILWLTEINLLNCYGKLRKIVRKCKIRIPKTATLSQGLGKTNTGNPVGENIEDHPPYKTREQLGYFTELAKKRREDEQAKFLESKISDLTRIFQPNVR